MIRNKAIAMCVAVSCLAGLGATQIRPIAATRMGTGVSPGPGMWMSVTGQRSGQIVQLLPFIEYSHEIVSPRDLASGLPTGKRMHKPFVIRRMTGEGCAGLMNACCTNEILTNCEFRFHNTNEGQDYLVVKLTNASIASIRHFTQEVGGKYSNYEEIAFTYQKIEWTETKGGKVFMDDWQVRV